MKQIEKIRWKANGENEWWGGWFVRWWRKLLGVPVRRSVRVYVLDRDRVFVPSEEQEKRLRWQRFLVAQELRRVQRWEEQREARRWQRRQ